MPRPICATIHTQGIRHNLARIRKAAPNSKVWAVVKANAYGLGIERVYEGIRSADGIALLDFEEAQRVRALGWSGPILLLEGIFRPQDLDLCSQYDLWQAVHCQEQIDMIAAHSPASPYRVFLKMNSGMNRLGFRPAKYRSAWERLRSLPQVAEISHMTHFSDADAPKGIAMQMKAFAGATQNLPGEKTLCNSAATLRHYVNIEDAAKAPLELVASDWIRSGIAIYGSAPDFPEHDTHYWDLEPVMTLAAEVIGIQELETGDTVGYGSHFTAPHPMRVGIISCGFADGYPRACPTGTPILIDGVRTRTLGRVSMDMMAVDLGPTPHAGFGSEAILWGRSQHGATLAIDEIAYAAGTVVSELMCALAMRVPVKID